MKEVTMENDNCFSTNKRNKMMRGEGEDKVLLLL